MGLSAIITLRGETTAKAWRSNAPLVSTNERKVCLSGQNALIHKFQSEISKRLSQCTQTPFWVMATTNMKLADQFMN